MLERLMDELEASPAQQFTGPKARMWPYQAAAGTLSPYLDHATLVVYLLMQQTLPHTENHHNLLETIVFDTPKRPG